MNAGRNSQKWQSVQRPQLGEHVTIPLYGATQDFALDFTPDTVHAARSGAHLVLSFEDGASVTLQNFYTIHTRNTLPDFEVAGTLVAGADFLAALGDALIPAAGEISTLSSGRFYNTESLNILPGVHAIDGLSVGVPATRLESHGLGLPAVQAGLVVRPVAPEELTTVVTGPVLTPEIPTQKTIVPSAEPPVDPPFPSLVTSVQPSILPPAVPSVDPPVQPPIESPVEPPVIPPVIPPVEPPVVPPVEPPVQPPFIPPVIPPVDPPHDPPAVPPTPNETTNVTWWSHGNIYGTNHDDTISIYGMSGGGIEAKQGQDTINIIQLSGTTLGDGIHGDQGKDSIHITSMSGGEVFGDVGDDFIRVDNMSGGSLYGGNGDDVLVIGKLSGGNINGGSGNDLFVLDTNQEVVLRLDNLGAVHADGSTLVVNTSLTGFESIGGGRGNDMLHGNIYGNSLYGGAGNDMLFGGRGSDILYGGEGKDTFVWSDQDFGGFTDTIKDFEVGKDSIKVDSDTAFTASGTMQDDGGHITVADATGHTVQTIVLESVHNQNDLDKVVNEINATMGS